MWLWGAGANVLTGLVAWSLGWVHGRGLVAGVAAGTVIYAGVDWRGWLLLLGFFVLGSLATRVGLARKEEMGIAQGRRGARGAREALANTAVALVLAVVSLFWTHAALPLAFAGAFATALADTSASELGPIWGRRTFLPLTFRRVPPGTEGAVSIEGTLIGAVAALVLSGIGLSTGFLPVAALWMVPVAAVAASYLESILGAAVKRGPLAQNEILNLLNTAVGALLAGGIFWVAGATS